MDIDTPPFSYLLKFGFPLDLAVKTGNLHMIERLLQHGYPTNANSIERYYALAPLSERSFKKYTPLQAAVKLGVLILWTYY